MLACFHCRAPQSVLAPEGCVEADVAGCVSGPYICLQGRLLGIKGQFTPQVAQVAIDLSGACDPQVCVGGG